MVKMPPQLLGHTQQAYQRLTAQAQARRVPDIRLGPFDAGSAGRTFQQAVELSAGEGITMGSALSSTAAVWMSRWVSTPPMTSSDGCAMLDMSSFVALTGSARASRAGWTEQ